MYDAYTASNIGTTATMVAGYGHWSAADWRRFPHAIKVLIATQPTHAYGVVLDVERGDATPAEAPGWVARRRAAHVDPTVYCSHSVWPTVRAAFTHAGVAQPHYWIAHWDGSTVIPAGAVAKQYLGNVNNAYDKSAVADYWPGVDPHPAPHPTPHPAGTPSWYHRELYWVAGKGKTMGGPDVLKVRAKMGLVAHGPGHYYDPVTAGRVKAFQHRHGLVADGVVGPRTATALGE